MSIRTAVDVAIRVRRLEKSRKMKMARQFEALTDNTFLDRATGPEDRVLFITPKGKAEGRRLVYSKNRNIVQ